MTAIKHLLPLALLVSLAACGDDITGSNDTDVNVGDLRGTMSFNYQGGGLTTGSFLASGKAPTDGSLGDWAGGLRTSAGEDASIALTGNMKSGNDYDVTTLVLDGTSAGRYTFGTNCDTSCAYGVVIFDLASQTDETSRVCNLTTGEVNLTSISGDEAKGNFSGTGTCLSNGTQVSQEFTVTGGTFSVKMAGK